ncbi:MAG: cysteine desulfurase [Holophagales bacterium]|nr:cysteine desulfurase [Holophagales bacterium]MYH24847.1 cysteine desulfurase [Holophagales bacterium]
MDDAKIIYADYQATTPVDPRVLERMAPYWSESFGNPHSTDHAIGWRAAKAVQEAAESVAGLIGADPDEIVFTSGATEANNLALFGLARRAAPGRNRILVSAIEHKCVLAASRALAAREGFIVETIPVDHEGFIDLAALEARLGEDVLVVSVMAVNNEIGTIQDVPRLAAVLTPFGVPLHCDAAQAPCGMAVGSLANHADLLSLSGHKVYGPQGIGALYVRRPLQRGLEPLVHGGGQQNGLRSGTVPLALCVGLAAAVDLLRGTETMAEMKRIGEQRDRFVRLLSSGDCSILVNGPSGNRRHPANANLGFEGVDAHDLLNVLQPRLAASTGAACTSGVPEASHVLSALGVTRTESDASIRFSFGRYTSDDEIERAASLVLQGVELLLSERPTRARAGELAI